jgi:hypothetical protein
MTLQEAIEIAGIAAGDGYRSYPGTGGIWAGGNNDIADATFVDWGLAAATARILNAVIAGELITARGDGR